MALGPKEAQLRAMREANASKTKPRAEPAKRIEAAQQAMANQLANAASTYKHRNPEERRAYQRDLMRKRRAEKTDASA
jgi:hypothetical protein